MALLVLRMWNPRVLSAAAVLPAMPWTPEPFSTLTLTLDALSSLGGCDFLFFLPLPLLPLAAFGALGRAWSRRTASNSFGVLVVSNSTQLLLAG